MYLNGKETLGGTLDSRRTETGRRIQELKQELQDANGLVRDVACVYMTGSFGRGEASPHSDLDLFIASQNDSIGTHLLSNLDEVLLKAELIKATRKLGFPDFSGDGEYLQQYSIHKLLKTLGEPEDDAKNTFTARLLLVLEGCCLLGSDVYSHVVKESINAYWRDYEKNRDQFVPAFLANDILRLWRTFCVNYEARTSSDPPRKRAKRKLKNYKLKHSRLLTCYSSLLYLLAIFSLKGTVTPEDAISMTLLTPTVRLESLLQENHWSSSHSKVKELLARYEQFLDSTNAPENELIDRYLSKSQTGDQFGTGKGLGDVFFSLLEDVGQRNRFHQLIVV
jgi:predicted nucleotidyltransferase